MTTKRLVVGAHYGLGSWLAQRATAVVMTVYTVVLLGWLFALPEFTYGTWAGMFASVWMKVLTLLALVSVLWHAWVGVRNIFMDYVKDAGLRLVLYVLVIVTLLAYGVWVWQILWGAV